MIAVRGATTVNHNDEKEILEETKKMLRKIIELNDINIDEIISVFFTMTKDLDAVYPAVAIREMGIVNAALMCYAELDVENSLEKCIRVMVQVDVNKKQRDCKHVYVNGAVGLRKDLEVQQ